MLVGFPPRGCCALILSQSLSFLYITKHEVTQCWCTQKKALHWKFLLLLHSIVAQHIFWWHFFLSSEPFPWTTFSPLFPRFNFLSFTHFNLHTRCMNVVHVRCNIFLFLSRICTLSVCVHFIESGEEKNYENKLSHYRVVAGFRSFRNLLWWEWIWLSLASHFCLTLHEPWIFHKIKPKTKSSRKILYWRKSLCCAHSTMHPSRSHEVQQKLE